MSSNLNNLYVDGFLTQWAFHRVQEHSNRSSDVEVRTFRSWRSYTVKSWTDEQTRTGRARLPPWSNIFYTPQEY